jgi:heat-inducible transcriptional repressor
MSLPERQRLILKEIVDRYIRHHEPVSSRMILEDYGLQASSATVRNDMYDLEAAGYIQKPYASSGRVPTKRGYQFFVNWLLDLSELTKKDRLEIVETYEMRCLEVGEAMRHTAFLLSNLTQYLGFVIPPRLEEARLDRLILSRLNARLALLVVISNIGIIEHTLIPLASDLTEDKIAEIAELINNRLGGSTLNALSANLAEERPEEWSDQTGAEALEALRRLLEHRMQQSPYFEGVFNLLPLLQQTHADSAMEHFANLIQAIHEDGEFTKAIRTSRQDTDGIAVAVGNFPLSGLGEYSVVTASFRPYSGVLGVIAPLWMDYSRALSVTSYIANRLEALLVSSCSSNFAGEADA